MTARRDHDRKRTGTPGWVRLGRELEARRAELDPAWENRAAFADATGANLKLIQDLERNDRENFTLLTLRDVIAPAYQVTYESILAVTAGTGDLEAAPGSPPRRRREPPRPVPPGGRFPATPAMQAAMAPHLVRLGIRLGQVRADPGLNLSPSGTPTGEQMFAGVPVFAADETALISLWDMFSGRTESAEDACELMAVFLAHQDERRAGHGEATGLTPRNSPVSTCPRPVQGRARAV